jgi:hypothetical protein
MGHDIEKIKTELANIGVDLSKGVEDPRLTTYLQILGKHLYSKNGWHETKEFLDLVNEAKRMALKRVWGRRQDLKTDILEYFDITSSNTSITNLFRDLTIITKEEKNRARQILYRLCQEGVLENNGRGVYNKPQECVSCDWVNAEVEYLKLWLPFEMSSPDFTMLNPGNIITYMGEPDSGKSAVAMNIAKENRRNYNVHYFSSELRAPDFKMRMSKFGDCSIQQMEQITFYPEINDYVSVIRTGRGNLNIIDYVELHDDFYKISKIFDGIHKKLDGALCVALLQKDPKKEYGTGGYFSQQKPVVSVSLSGGNIACITKQKGWNPKIQNPKYKVYRYKLVDGCRFMRATHSVGWTTREQSGVSHGV